MRHISTSIHEPDTAPALPPWLRNCPSAWNAETLDRDALRSCARAMRQHPRFDQAQRRFALNMLEAFENSPPLNRLLRGEGELAFLAFVLSLHYRRDPNDPESGATYSRVAKLFGLLKLGSPTLVKTLLSLARLRGHLQVEPVIGRRVKLLVPTEKLLNTLQIWFHANLSAVELIEPLPGPATELAARPEMLYQTFSYAVDAYIHNQFFLSEDFPPVRAFMARNHGYLILMALIASTERRADGRVIASVPSADLARRLSLSRGTVRNMLNQACQHGWITSISRGSHQVDLSTAFAERCKDWMSMELTWMGGAAKIACTALR